MSVSPLVMIASLADVLEVVAQVGEEAGRQDVKSQLRAQQPEALVERRTARHGVCHRSISRQAASRAVNTRVRTALLSSTTWVNRHLESGRKRSKESL